MRFYTEDECSAWLEDRGCQLPTVKAAAHKLTIWYPPNPASIDFFGLVQSMSFREPILLWITEWGIWPSSENWHLYNRLRQSYRDDRLLHEAPGHYFQNYEMDDLATFLQVAATNGWGGYILTSRLDINAFFSHDEYLDVFAEDKSSLDAIQRRFEHLLKPPESFHSAGGRARITAAGEYLTPEEVHPPDEKN